MLQHAGYSAFIMQLYCLDLIAVYDHTAHTLQRSSSIPAVYTVELVECTFSAYCNYTSLYCISTALRSGRSNIIKLERLRNRNQEVSVLKLDHWPKFRFGFGFRFDFWLNREGTANALKNTLGKKHFTFTKGRS